MIIKNIVVSLKQVIQLGESFGLEPQHDHYILADDLVVTEDEISAITNDVISFLQQNFEGEMQFLAFNIDGTRYSIGGQLTLTGPNIDFLADNVRNFLQNELAKENNASEA